MKKLLFFSMILLFMVKAEAQKCKAKDMPPAVMDAFNKAYPNTKKTYCGKDSSNYQVSFFNGKAPVSVTYDAAGKRLITEMQMAVEDLPQSITDYVQKNYPGEIFQDVAQITNADEKVTYEVQVKDMDLIFDAKGDFLESMKCYD